MIKIVPILMRNNDHEVVKVGNAQYNDVRDTITIRLELDASVIGPHHILGKAIQMELLEAIKIEPVVPEFVTSAVKEEAEFELAANVGENVD